LSHDGSHFVGGDVGCVGAVLQLFLLLVLLHVGRGCLSLLLRPLQVRVAFINK
jgi:hypothetical protein